MITTKSKTEDSEESKEINFYNILLELLGDDDDQEKLLIMDFLLIDHVHCQSSLNSAEIKSALCAYEIEDHESINQWIQNVVKAF
mgnify:FL=1|jgi:hypothetical protein